MQRYFTLSAVLALLATPALASSEPFFSVHNPHTVELVSFLLFVGVLIYLKVPGVLGGLLDKRAETIRGELDEAKALREEAQGIMASYERKQKDVAEQTERIIKYARDEAATAAEEAKEDLAQAIARRLKAADEQIASAEKAAVRAVRDRAIAISVAAAGDFIAGHMTAAQSGTLIDAAIGEVQAKLH